MTADHEDLVAISKMLGLKVHGNEALVNSIFGDNNAEHKLSDLNNYQLLQAITKRFEQSNDGTVFTIKHSLRSKESTAFPKEFRQRLSKDSSFWSALNKLDGELRDDFATRRAMLLLRFDCTVESFKWKTSNSVRESTKVGKFNEEHESFEKLNNKIHELYHESIADMKRAPTVSIADLLALRK